MIEVKNNVAKILISSTWGYGGYFYYLFIKKYKKKPGYRLELKKKMYGTGRWYTDRKGLVRTKEDVFTWVEKNSWIHVAPAEIEKALQALEGGRA